MVTIIRFTCTGGLEQATNSKANDNEMNRRFLNMDSFTHDPNNVLNGLKGIISFDAGKINLPFFIARLA
jgi:hypothetical protein